MVHGMPIDYARRLTGTVRTTRENAHLGVGLAFVAGATNAGAFLAVSQYTSVREADYSPRRRLTGTFRSGNLCRQCLPIAVRVASIPDFAL